MPIRSLLALIGALLLAACAYAATPVLKISNPLGLDWPGELVHWDVPALAAAGEVSVKIGDTVRPAQVEPCPDDTTKKRVWFVASQRRDEQSTTVTLVPGATASLLTVTADGPYLVVSNGVYDFRVPNYSGAFGGGRAAKDVTPPIAGMRLTGDQAGWYGRSWFTGQGTITSAKTTVTARGPVFATITVDYNNGAHRTTLRFVAGDAWVEATEAYKGGFPYALELKDNLKPDTAMWVPWFGFKGFGGNNQLRFSPLQPQEMQRGAFVTLQPKWTQTPGGGQDFFVTRGGDTKDGKEPDAPAVGVVAIHASEWQAPYQQMMSAYAEQGDTARVEFPTETDGSRSYAICVGPRSLFDNTGKMNFFIRRHADWTLDNQIHNYILTWERDPKLAGPHIVMSPEELKQLQDDYKSGKDTAQMRVLRGYLADRARLKGRELDLLKLIIGEPVGAYGMPNANIWVGTRYQDDFLNPTTNTRRLKDSFPWADLFNGGKPMGNGWTAAAGYIFSDLNQWPGYQNGWWPGNPNFHTDKYSVSLFAGASMLDHPHAKEWLAFGKKNFEEDTAKVLSEPDGVGFECPGYSTYSLGLQLDLAKVLRNVGMGNPVVENPMFKKTGIWHRNLLTPVDPRINIRHQAPIGDTHRWGQADGALFGRLAKFFNQADPQFASEMMGVWQLFRQQGMKGDLITDVVDIDQSIPPMPLEKMTWGSAAYQKFGAILRNNFGTPRESFVTFKAGELRGHYHNDELSYHFYGAGMPISLDYNCSYHPRGDHAALHNSMTFGVQKPFTHSGQDKTVDAMEQLGSAARVGAFASTPAADVVVAERSGDHLELTPTYPDDAIFGYRYPSRAVKPIVHRRTLLLVKHPVGSALQDYLVVRDEVRGDEPQQLNIHLLSRDVQRQGNLIRATGQWGADMTVYLAQADVTDFNVGRWYYFDEQGKGPNGEPNAEWMKTIHDTDGKALIPPADWKGTWTVGEYQQWLKIGTKPGSTTLWVLYPRTRGEAEPTFTTLPGGAGVRVQLGQTVDEVSLGNGVTVQQNGTTTTLLKANAVPALGAIK